MTKKGLQKLFVLLLAVVLLGNTFLAEFPAFAVNEKGGMANPCENHLVHDDTCGFMESEEGFQCTHPCELCGQEAEQAADTSRESAVSQNSAGMANGSTLKDAIDVTKAVTENSDANKLVAESSDVSKESDTDAAVENVLELIAALPKLDAVKAQSREEQEASYRQVQEAYEAYESLTEEQKAEINGGEDNFAPLLAYFDSLVTSADEEVEWVEEDLSDYIFQEGGSSVLDEPAPMSLSLDDEIQAHASDTEGAKAALIAGMKAWESSIDLSSYEILLDEVKALYIDTINYNPDLFYVSNASYFYNPDTKMVTSVEPIYNTDNYSKADVEKYNAARDAAFAEALPDTSGMSDLQKALALHDYLAQHMYYNYASGNTPGDKHNAYNALVEGTAVCQGYTLAYAALLQKAGISVDFAVSDAMDHIWNYVQIDGQWYHVDVTWDDPSPDRAGYVAHRYFMNSDTKIGTQESSDSAANDHYGWVAKQSCNSTAYDNAYWQDVSSAIFYMNDGEYYLKGSVDNGKANIDLTCRKNDVESSVYGLETDVWKVSGGSYYTSVFSSLSRYDGKLYFNDTKKLYRISSGQNTAAAIYTYEDTAKDLYGSLVCKGEILREVGTSYDAMQKLEKIALPDENVKSVSITGSPSQVVYGYASAAAPVLTAEAVRGSDALGEVSYQWYKVNNGVETAIDEATAASYTVETGLDAGTYTYRVKAALGDSDKSADAEVTITQAPLTVTADPQTIVYGETIENTAGKAAAEGLVSGHRLSGVTLTSADKNVTENGTVTP